MDEMKWSHGQKERARQVFDLALDRELKALRRNVESILANSPGPEGLWQVQDLLSRERREIDLKYDYRYSILVQLFARLVAQGWLEESDLAGIGEEKIAKIRQRTAYFRGDKLHAPAQSDEFKAAKRSGA
jgi:hypothetical protein